MAENEQAQAVDATKGVAAQIDQATNAVSAQVNELEQLQAGGGGDGSMSLSQLLAVGVEVTVEVGRARSTFSELMKMGPGTLLELDRDAHEPADILVNGKIVANGEIVTIGDRYGVRITAVLNE